MASQNDREVKIAILLLAAALLIPGAVAVAAASDRTDRMPVAVFDLRPAEARVITPEFRVREGDRLKTVVVYTKMCRGEMTRHILKNRIADPATLRSFEWEGFRLDPALSKGDDWVFTL